MAESGECAEAGPLGTEQCRQAVDRLHAHRDCARYIQATCLQADILPGCIISLVLQAQKHGSVCCHLPTLKAFSW